MTRDPIMVERFVEVWRSLKKESDRGSVIVAAAVLEDQLEELLKNRLVQNSDQSDPLFDGANSAIGTFSAKIELAYRIGAISQKVRQSVNILRRLRNDFAHFADEINFESNSVKDRTRNLLTLNRELVELIWSGVREDIYKEIGINEPPECTDYFTDMIQNAGYRHTFQLWASILVGVLAEKAMEIQRLEATDA